MASTLSRPNVAFSITPSAGWSAHKAIWRKPQTIHDIITNITRIASIVILDSSTIFKVVILYSILTPAFILTSIHRNCWAPGLLLPKIFSFFIFLQTIIPNPSRNERFRPAQHNLLLRNFAQVACVLNCICQKSKFVLSNPICNLQQLHLHFCSLPFFFSLFSRSWLWRNCNGEKLAQNRSYGPEGKEEYETRNLSPVHTCCVCKKPPACYMPAVIMKRARPN